MNSLIALKDTLELFLLSHPSTIICDPRAGLLKLEDSHFCFEIQFGKLLFTLWNSDQSITRRVISLEECENDRLVLQVAYGGAPPFNLEFDALVSSALLVERKASRRRFPGQILQILRSHCPEIRIERMISAKDLSRSFSEHFCRGIGVERNCRWAVFGVNPAEDQSTVDACLSFALIWMNQLRTDPDRRPVVGLKLLVPEGRSYTMATRAAYLQSAGLRLDLLEYGEDPRMVTPVDLADYGNVETKLSRVDQVPLRYEQIPFDALPAPIRSRLDLVEIVHRPASRLFSIRFHGLEFARLGEEKLSRVNYGVGSMERAYKKGLDEELSSLLSELQAIRCPRSPAPRHPYYRLQSERWLESLVLSDIRQIHFNLDPGFVYPQVPAFSGLDRGVIDILTLTRDRRLAVIELKVAEDINLPLQALDYWTRVKWHHERGDFERQGYFSGVKVGPRPPVLYVVSPAFRFHSTTEGILKYLPPEIEVIKVGLNENWREGIQVMYRRRV
ncbi:MAG: hypothetical protein LAO31_07970 [Acidobacteriia bacterium]|nr:hypothetical protein [Terriglobia bacterium]